MPAKKYFTNEEKRQAQLEANRRWYHSKPENKELVAKLTREWRDNNRDRVNELSRELYIKNPPRTREATMLKASRRRARINSLEFNLELEDIVIPDVCPVLEIPLSRDNSKTAFNSPSLDRRDTSKGYIKGNVFVISWRANRIKSDATIEELQKILAYASQLR